ncbi:MAG: hypothetical protein AB7O96_18240 [Pseudobdellovibrionaceae bacterium]
MKHLLFTILITTGSIAYAGREVGNGGDGIYLGGKLYSLDLVDSGVEENPYFEDVTADPQIKSAIEKKFKSIPSFPTELLSKKLTEIRAKHPMYGYRLYISVMQLVWSAVSQEIMEIDDEEAVLNYPPNSLVQIAARVGSSVLMDRNLLAVLAPEQRVALILHEANYYLAPLEKTILGYKPGHLRQPIEGYKQSSFLVRQATGLVFKDGWQAEEVDALQILQKGSNYYDYFLSSIPANTKIKMTMLNPTSFGAYVQDRALIDFNRSWEIISASDLKQSGMPKLAKICSQFVNPNTMGTSLAHVRALGLEVNMVPSSFNAAPLNESLSPTVRKRLLMTDWLAPVKSIPMRYTMTVGQCSDTLAEAANAVMKNPFVK